MESSSKDNLSVDLLVSRLDETDVKSYEKIEIMFKLMNVADDKSLDAIFKVLRDDECELVRHEAAFCLGEMSSSRAVLVLKEVLGSDDSIVVKHECLMSLGTIGSLDDVSFIEKFLESEIEEINSSAKIAIERINQKEFFGVSDENFEFYSARLLDPVNTCRNERIQIIFQLMRVSSDRAIDVLYDCLLNDPCPIVRHEAAFVLGEIGCTRSIFYLKDAIEKEKNPVVIHEALFALGTSGKKEILSFLENFLDDENYLISESSKIAIDRLNFLENPYSGKKEYDYLN